MQRPDNKLEKLLNKIGVFTEAKSDEYQQSTISINIEVPLNDDDASELLEFNVVTVSGRGVRIVYSNWSHLTRGDKKLLRFSASLYSSTVLPAVTTSRILATSFADLCWYSGAEAINPNIIAVEAPIAEDAEYVDLGWHLPARFVDQLIDSMGKLNETLFNGRLMDSVLYAVV